MRHHGRPKGEEGGGEGCEKGGMKKKKEKGKKKHEALGGRRSRFKKMNREF
jgi:hypothetical protein